MDNKSAIWFGRTEQPLDANMEEHGGAPTPLLMRYWRIVMRRRRLIAAVVAITLAIGLLTTLLMTRMYLASATLEISRQQDRIVSVDQVKPESSFVDQEFYQTQYSLLEARTLAEAVATELKLVQNDAFFAMFDLDPDENGLFENAKGTSLTRAQLANRHRVATKILLDNISISPTRGSRLVTIGFLSPDAEFSAKVINSWTSNFVKQDLSRRFNATSYARNFLEGRLNQVRQRLEESERAVVAYARDNEIINVPTATRDSDGSESERSIIADDLAALNRALTEATAARIAAASRASGSGDVSREALENIALSNLRRDQAEAAAEHARLRTQFEPTYPPVRALAAKLAQFDRAIAREESRIRGNISMELSTAARRESQLRDEVQRRKAQLMEQRQRSIQYAIYQRDADTNRQLYDGLLQRYKEIGVAGGVGNNNISVIDPAQVPNKPYSPRFGINLLLALVVGLGSGLALAFLLEQIEEAIRDPSEIGELTGLPLLGVIPASSGEDIGKMLSDPKSMESEAYLSIQTGLQFATDHGVPRSFTVTSTQPSEGKSTSAFAVALSLARTKRSVVLIDGDMRSPSVHHFVGIENRFGVSNLLSGDYDLERALVPVPELGLTVVTAGPTPPSAGELLTGPKAKELIDDLATRFDCVVVDSPPIVGLADALLLASCTEGLIFVIEAGAARAGQIRTALERLRQARIRPVGAILTKFDANKAQYGYGYEYAYGYGRENQTT